MKREIGKIERATITLVASNPKPALVEEVRAQLVASRDDNAAAVRVLDKFSRDAKRSP